MQLRIIQMPFDEVPVMYAGHGLAYQEGAIPPRANYSRGMWPYEG